MLTMLSVGQVVLGRGRHVQRPYYAGWESALPVASSHRFSAAFIVVGILDYEDMYNFLKKIVSNFLVLVDLLPNTNGSSLSDRLVLEREPCM